MSAEARSKHNRSDMKRNKRKSRITRPAASVGASIDQGSCTSDKLESSAYEDTVCASTYVYHSFDPTDARVYDVRLYLWWTE